MEVPPKSSRSPAAFESALSASTRLEEKRRFYAQESWFREAWADIDAVFGVKADEFLLDYANFMIKPDGIVGRHVDAVLEFLERHDVEPVAAAEVEFSRTLTRVLWQYKQNSAPIDHLRLLERLQLATPSLFMLVRTRRSLPVPLSVRLTAIKGPGRLEKRRREHLRSILGVPTRFMNVVHSADEPADHVRELGLFFDAKTRHKLLLAAKSQAGAAAQVRLLADGLYQRFPQHDLDFGNSFRRLAAATPLAPTAEEPTWAQAREAVLNCEGGPAEWDAIVTGAHLIKSENADEVPLIPTDAQELWS